MPLIAACMDRAGSASPISTALPSLSVRAASPGCASASRPRAGWRSPRASRRSGSPPCRAFAAPLRRRATKSRRSSLSSMRGTSMSMCRSFGAGGRTLVPPRIAPLREAVRVSLDRRAPRLVGTAADLLAARWPRANAAAAGRAAPRAGHRLGRAARRRRAGASRAAASRSICARRTRSRRTPRSSPPMIDFCNALLAVRRAGCSRGGRARCRAIAALHARVVPPRLERGGGRRAC